MKCAYPYHTNLCLPEAAVQGRRRGSFRLFNKVNFLSRCGWKGIGVSGFVLPWFSLIEHTPDNSERERESDGYVTKYHSAADQTISVLVDYVLCIYRICVCSMQPSG